MSVIQQALIFGGGSSAAAYEIWVAARQSMDPDFEGNLYAFIESENEFLITGYTNNGFEIRRYNAANLAYIATLTYFTDNWDWDGYDLLYDPSGYIWLGHSWDQKIARITIADWSVTEFTPSVWYFSGFINPINNDLYMADYNDSRGFFKVNKLTGEPIQTYFMGSPNLILTSPYTGYTDSTWTYLYLGPVVFVSATEAYTRHYNGNDVFHVNLTTGIFTFVFRLMMDPEPRAATCNPIHYDSASNTLWLHSTNSSPTEIYQTPPAYKTHSLYAWIVGTEPSTMLDYPITYNDELLQSSNTGVQQEWIASEYIDVTPDGLGAWIGFSQYPNNYGSPPAGIGWDSKSEDPPGLRFFSFSEKEFTKTAVDTAEYLLPLPYSSNQHHQGFNSWSAITTNDTVWFLGMYNNELGPGGSLVSNLATKMYKLGNKTATTGRYIRITIYDIHRIPYYSGALGPVCLQELEVRSTPGGVNIATVVTASSEEPEYPASNLLNTNIVDYREAWVAGSNQYPQVLFIDTGTIQPISEIVLWPRNWRVIPPGNTTSYPYGSYMAPSEFKIEISNDGSSWVGFTEYKGVMAWPVAQVTDTYPSSSRTFPVVSTSQSLPSSLVPNSYLFQDSFNNDNYYGTLLLPHVPDSAPIDFYWREGYHYVDGGTNYMIATSTGTSRAYNAAETPIGITVPFEFSVRFDNCQLPASGTTAATEVAFDGPSSNPTSKIKLMVGQLDNISNLSVGIYFITRDISNNIVCEDTYTQIVASSPTGISHSVIAKVYSSEIKFYINGVLSHTFSGTTILDTGTYITAKSPVWAVSGDAYCGISDISLKHRYVYPSIATPPITPIDPLFSNVVLLLHMNGTNGSTTFTDSSSYSRTPSSVTGSVAIDTSQSKFSGSSANFTGGYIQYADSTDFTLGANDFCIEAWVMFNSDSVGDKVCVIGAQDASGGGSNPWLITKTVDEKLSFSGYFSDNSTYSAITTTYVVPSVWYHIALVRRGEYMILYVNGANTVGYNAMGVKALKDSSNALGIGIFGENTGSYGGASGTRMMGWLAEVRYTVGISRYAGYSFSLPYAPFPNS